jgi:hypothetical protein
VQVRGQLLFVVDLTCHNTNHFVLVEGPEISVHPVAKRQVKAGEPPVTAAGTLIDSSGVAAPVQRLAEADGSASPAQARRSPSVLDLWVRRCSALLVAAVAAYSSYEHQRRFAATGGAEATAAGLWPLSVDGLVLLASIDLLRAGPLTTRRNRFTLWLAFGLGIVVSLAANVAAAPALGWQPVLVAGWPPVALLLAVELLAHRPTPAAGPQLVRAAGHAVELSVRPRSGDGAASAAASTAEQRMWEHYQHQRTAGRTPTGAELDRIAGTNNYGRAVLARWRRTGRIPTPAT